MKLKPTHWFLIGFGLLSVLVFAPVLKPGMFLLTTDDSLSELALRKRALPDAWLAMWADHLLVGHGGYMQFNLSNLLLFLMPAVLYANWFHALCLFGAAVFLAMYLSEMGLRAASAFLGGLVFAWLGSNMTLTYAGHLPKFTILALASFFLWSSRRALAKGSLAWTCLAGGALGGMFLEIQDMALFFSMLLGCYLLYAIHKAHGRNTRAWMKVLVPALAVCLLAMLRPAWDVYRTGVRGVAAISDEDPAAKWAYATQWSWPPEESIDFVAQGYMGWRSGEQKGPYWGRMGRSEGWEETKQGFMNFKLENQYLGAIPLLFALYAVFAGWRKGEGGQARAEWQRDIIFWSSAALVTLLLSFGKYFPLYRLFYELPAVSSIRNPNKFLQVFQLALAVVAAYGLDRALRAHEPQSPEQAS